MTTSFSTAPDGATGALVLRHEIPARQPWSGIIRKGQVFRLIDTCGQQAVDTLFYRAGDHAERYSAQNTLQAQGSAYISTGTQLVSNDGNVMLTVTADSCGRHDTSAGACSCESNTVRFGHHTKFEHACRENFAIEVARHGMTKRDIVPNINFFMNVPIAPNGDLVIDDGISAPGSYVEMVAEMDVLCVIFQLSADQQSL
jgi:urea carboxylase-associated protein 1